MKKMKAVVCTKYGPPEVLILKEVTKPIPKKNEALIKVYASTVTTGDCKIRRFDFDAKWFWLPGKIIFGFTKPRRDIPGWELAGEIESVGKDSLCGVTLFYYFLFFHMQQMPEDFLPAFVICKLVILC